MILARKLGLALTILVSSVGLTARGQTIDSICTLQEKIAQGQHIAVRISGLYTSGVDMGVLDDAVNPGCTTWVELDLRSSDKRGRLKKAMDAFGGVNVVFEGEFYGPPLPDPKLPEAFRREYHPGWGHLGLFKSKIAVHLIVKADPAYGKLIGTLSSYKSPFPLQVSLNRAPEAGLLGTQRLSDERRFEFDGVEPGQYVVTVTNSNNCIEYRTSARVKAGRTKKVSIGRAEKLRPDCL